ncbi:hypothetical protein CAMRE0001_3178 [Campylobacter rectus RM3267]|uniref:Uncharacterized protein n=1 Tax=Campylobacter rectus RM3267 TaxID=553218 RepID=B9D191_CAMRE|nr:hypothetical protein CAMRE0001_3178 [Campylobacter rectus RM3267]
MIFWFIWSEIWLKSLNLKISLKPSDLTAGLFFRFRFVYS